MASVELRIERLTISGDGVAHHNGRAIFVPGVTPGDLVRVDVREAKHVLRGAVTQLLEAGAARVEPACPLAQTCGGCDWMHVSPAVQLAQKQAFVLGALEHVGGLDLGSIEVRPSVESGQGLGYRRRAALHPVQGRFGYFAKGTHERVIVDACPALTPALEWLPSKLGDAFGAFGKDLEELRVLEIAGRVAVSLHLKGAPKAKHEAAAEAAVRQGLLDGVVLVPADGKGAPATFGAVMLEDRDGTLHRPDGFAQANEAVNRALVACAAELLSVDAQTTVLELYSGNGNFTRAVAPRSRQVVAVESSPLGNQLAQLAIRKSGAQNVRLVQGDAEKIADGFVKEGERFDRLLLDPPRAGAPRVDRWADRLLVHRVVYVACDPGALARDAKALVGAGFAAEAVQVFDLFPQTRHVEALMSFVR